MLDTAVVGEVEVFCGPVVMVLEYETEDGEIKQAPSGQDGLVEVVPGDDGISPVIVAPKRLRGHELRTGFNAWWTNKVIDSADGHKTFSRRRVVLVMANKDGGAHVEPTGPDADYLKFSADGHGGMFSLDASAGLESSQGFQPYLGNAAAETVRQIAWELTETFNADDAIAAWLAIN
uniref:hypothetical protein n=1 Tax=Rhodococcus sp. H36-A4 TaxID=3004353 RepID=UPI0022AFFFA3|nr:hypothetical protein [Rhodococcus sp. H36-A4]